MDTIKCGWPSDPDFLDNKKQMCINRKQVNNRSEQTGNNVPRRWHYKGKMCIQWHWPWRDLLHPWRYARMSVQNYVILLLHCYVLHQALLLLRGYLQSRQNCATDQVHIKQHNWAREIWGAINSACWLRCNILYSKHWIYKIIILQ